MHTPKRMISIAFVLVLFSAFPAAAVASTSESDRLYSLGREAFKRHSNAEAITLFKKSVTEDPNNTESHYYLGLLYSQNIATYEIAEDHLLELPALAMKQGSGKRDDIIFRSGVALGKLYAKSGKNRQAIRLVRNVIAAAPAKVALDEAYSVLGLCLYYERLYEDAIFELRKAFMLNPGNTAASFNLKTIRTRLEHFNAAKIYSRMGDHVGAIDEYRNAISLDPRFIDARYRLGVELLLNGSAAEALKELHRAESVTDQYSKVHEIRYAMGMAYRDLGMVEEAQKRFQQVLELKPRFAPAINEIGKLAMLKKDYGTAIARFAEAIAIDPRGEYASNLETAIVGQAGKRD